MVQNIDAWRKLQFLSKKKLTPGTLPEGYHWLRQDRQGSRQPQEQWNLFKVSLFNVN
jgi:hypothetical protein